MRSVLEEIKKLRKGRELIIDYRNSNRYRIIAAEEDGTKTGYCFSVPIYNQKSRKLVKLQFHPMGNAWFAHGSSAEITVTDDFLLENDEETCRISFQDKVTSCEENVIHCNMTEVYPTINGLVIKAPCSSRQQYQMTLSSGHPFINIRTNDRYFSFMSEELRPFATISCIGALDGSGRLIAPCKVENQKCNDRGYKLSFHHNTPYGKYVMFEINLHEAKLFQDTTVESLHPELNNVFGGTAFIGNTTAYGEQWLYTRPDFSRIPEMLDRQIYRAIFHLPKYGGRELALSAFRVAERFCSFGSNWDNKVSVTEALPDFVTAGSYYSLDITNLIADAHTHFLIQSEGLILRTKQKGSGFTTVATGDSYCAPQILEINFR